MELLDTSVIVSRINKGDSGHAKAAGMDFSSAAVNELVLAELASVLYRGSSDRPAAVRAFLDVFSNVPLALASQSDLRAGAKTYAKLHRKLSYADCVLLAQARRCGAGILTFDAELARAFAKFT